ncbi:TetR/AcrR family transcriptional regulator [soil metagenome]
MATKAAYHHGNLKQALIAAAMKEIAADGIEAFSLRGVARRAGVSAPAVYRHFADKEALLVAVATQCAERLGAVMVEAVNTAPAEPLEQFRATGIATVRFAVAHPEHYRLICMPGVLDAIPEPMRAKQKAFQDEQREKLREAQAKGLIADLPLDDLLLTAQATVSGLAHAIIEGRLGDIDDARAAELAIAVTGVLGVGLIPRDEDVADPYRKMVVRTKRR